MGNLLEYIKMAVKNILANKGRSFLTMLGIIIGIASVIMIMSVGDGTANAMTAEADALGGGQLYISCSDDAVTDQEMITQEDLDAIVEQAEGVEGATPMLGDSATTVTQKGEFDVSLSGGSQDYQRINSYNIKRGRYFDQEDVAEARNVCVILDSDAKRLFGSDDVIGMEVEATAYGMSLSYRIIGVMAAKENTAFVSYTYEGMPVELQVPYTTLRTFGDEVDSFYGVYLFSDKTMDSKAISDQAVRILESRHQSGGKEYYQVESFQDMLKSINTMMGMVTAFISCVAAISLLVGGIGVMNIMLVSVTERTREIGIRKSLGAKTSSITTQFLAESAILTAIGGILGICLGLLGAYGICAILSSSMGSVIEPGVKASTILGATFFSCAVGIFFGIYPARKAAKLSPIEALRRN